MSGRSLPDFAIGTRLFIGGYGSVHRGVGPVGEEVFALVVAGELADRSRFEEELRAAALALGDFAHPHAVRTHLVDRDPSGRLVAITEPVAAPVALASALRAGGRPPAAVAMALGRELCQAVAAAHDSGIVHGALHPQSVLIDGEGRANLADFAPARALAETAATDDVDLLEGIRPYLAPEFDFGDRPGPASDVYGLGALLFELWAGRPPPGDIAGPPEVRRVIERALRSDPVARFEAADELERALAAAASGAGILPALPWQVAAWVREHVEARKRGAEAHLRAAKSREGAGPAFSRVPDVAPRPRQTDLSLAAAAARAGSLRTGGGGHRTPTPLADARDVLGASSTADALGRLDRTLAVYDRDGEDEAAAPAGNGPAERRIRPGELAALVLAVIAVVTVVWALVVTARAGGDEAADEGADGGRILKAESPLVS